MNVTYDNNTTGKCSVSPNTFNKSNIEVGDIFTITANSGYKFDGVVGEYNTTSPQVRIASSRTSNNYVYFNRTISADNKTITITCIKETQKLLGVTADGIIGNITLGALNAYDVVQFDKEFDKIEMAYYDRIAKAKPHLAINLKGWFNRAIRV